MTADPAQPPALSELLRQQAWARELAARLVTDAAQADDVVQEAWLVALRTQDGHVRAPRGWFAGVLRNIARTTRRSAGRRTRHEAAWRPAGSAPSAGDVVARSEAHERLVAAVNALGEPYRSTVLLRYFDGLAPRDVAARMRVPVETVRTRLRRALARLRESLDTGSGADGRSWALALVPLAREHVPFGPALSRGDLIVGVTKKKAAVVAACTALIAALIGGAAVLVSGNPEPVGPRGPDVEAASAGAGEVERDPSRETSRAKRVRRRSGAVDEGVQVTDGAAPLPRVTLVLDALARTGATPPRVEGATETPPRKPRIRVTDADGNVLSGARITIRVPTGIPEPGDWAASLMRMVEPGEPAVVVETGPDGTVDVPDLHGGHWQVSVEADGHATATLPMRAIGATMLDAGLTKSHDVRGTLTGSDGVARSGVMVMLTQRASEVTAGARSLVLHRTLTDELGRFHLTGVGERDYGVWAALPDSLPVAVGTVSVPQLRDSELMVYVGGRVQGTVVDDTTGIGIAGARILALGKHGYCGRAISDADGNYAIDVLGSGPIKRLEAWHPDYTELAHHDVPIHTAPDDVHRRDFSIYRGGTITGIVRGPDGPVAGATVQVWVGDRSKYITHRSGRTDAEGNYRIETVRPGYALVEVTARGLVHDGAPGAFRRWGALLDGKLDERCSVTVLDNAQVRLDVELSARDEAKRATSHPFTESIVR